MKTKMLAGFLSLVLLLSCCPLWAAAEPETSDPAPVAAETGGFAALTFLDVPGCATVITDLGGAEHTYPGCLDVSALEENPCCERIASYRIELNGETLLEVTLRDIHAEGGVSLQESMPMSNGYYAVQFDLNDEQEAFLTGLTPEKLDKVQQEILDAGLAGQDVSLEDIDFIDTEKAESLFNLENRPDTDGDLCWAAATSNMLHYTGWGRQAGFGSTDYLFDLFTTRFDDRGAPPLMAWTGFSTAGISRRNGRPGSMSTTIPTAGFAGICRAIRRKPSRSIITWRTSGKRCPGSSPALRRAAAWASVLVFMIRTAGSGSSGTPLPCGAMSGRRTTPAASPTSSSRTPTMTSMTGTGTAAPRPTGCALWA